MNQQEEDRETALENLEDSDPDIVADLQKLDKQIKQLKH